MQDQFTTIDGIRIRYRDSGGPGLPVILTHGIGGALELWSPQLDGLGQSHRIIAWDVPNHGLSDLTGRTEDWESYARWLLRLVDALRIDRAILAGNSMGGGLSLRVAGLVPDRVAGILLANAASLGPDVFPVFRMMTLPFLGEAMNRPGEAGLDRMLSAIVRDPSCVDAPLRAALLRNMHKPGGTRAFLATLRACTSVLGQRASTWKTSQALLSRLEVPMLILHGRQDAVVPLKHSEDAARRARHAQLVVLDDCGHTPQIEQPAAFNAALRGFAAGLE